MSNKYLYMVLGAIVTVVWYYVGNLAYFSYGTPGLSEAWWLGTVLAVGLGAGSTGGTCAVTVLVESIKGYVSTLILLAIVAFVGHGVYVLVTMQTIADPAMWAKVVLTFVVSGFLTNLMFSYLKKANA